MRIIREKFQFPWEEHKRIDFQIKYFEEIFNKVPNYLLKKDPECGRGVIFYEENLIITISKELASIWKGNDLKTNDLISKIYSIFPNEVDTSMTANEFISNRYYNSGNKSCIQKPIIQYHYPYLNIHNPGLLIIGNTFKSNNNKKKKKGILY